MRAIIDGKVYDTNTATKLASAISGTLWITSRRAYFLVVLSVDLLCRQIVPLQESEARRWVERKANTEYERIFGPAEET